MSRLKEIRERLGLTQTEMGVVLDCTQGNVGFYERGDQELKPSKAEMLIEYAATKGLRLTLDQVYGRAPLPGKKRAAAKGKDKPTSNSNEWGSLDNTSK